MRRTTYKIELILLGAGTVFLFASLIVSSMLSRNLKEYNRHVCAVYGYYEDCKTPLPESMRLK